MRIIPAILVKTFDEFLVQIQNLKPSFSSFHIDIGDGKFVPNTTIQIDTLLAKKQKLASQIDHFSFDFHLMIIDYQKEIEKLEKLKQMMHINNIFIHVSLSPNIENLMSNTGYASFGLVLNPNDQVKEVAAKYNLATIPFIQIMSVNPGFQGSPFIKESLKKIEQLRRLHYTDTIYLDGAVNDKTTPFILSQEYQPDVLCVGSYLTKRKDVEKRIKILQKQVSG